VASALASFESALFANSLPFDQWMRCDCGAQSECRFSGMQEFVLAGCAECHSGLMFSKFEPHTPRVREVSQVTVADSGGVSFCR
jgi:cytochrome c peroxidase